MIIKFFQYINGGGISRYFYELINNFQDIEDVFVSLPFPFTYNEHLSKDKNFNFKRVLQSFDVPYKRTLINTINKKAVIKELEKKNFSIMHPTYYDSFFLKYIDKKPLVLTVFDTICEKYPEEFKRTKEIIENKKQLIKRANKIIAISQNTKNDIINFYDIKNSKIDVIYLASSLNINLTDDVAFSDMPGKYLLYVGNRSGYKNFVLMLEAISQILKDDNDLFLICAGGGKFNKTEKKIIMDLKLENCVYQKKIDDETLSYLYKNAIALIYPSLYEGFGIPIIEAMGLGCPVITGHISSMPEISGDAAVLFDPKSIDSIKSNVSDTIYNSKKLNSLKDKGIVHSKKFSWQKTTKQTLSLYNDLIYDKLD